MPGDYEVSYEEHLRDNVFTGHSQHGFMRLKSCLTNSISLHDKVIHLTDQEKPVDVVVPDFRKVFDTVPYTILLKKQIQYTATQIHTKSGEELEDDFSSKGYITLRASYQWGPQDLISGTLFF